MIVHPIGMMRANAAGGLNFVDDFTSYTLGANLRDQAAYQYAGGNNDVVIADSGGVRVARLLGGLDLINFVGGSPALDREVSVTVKTFGQTNSIAVYLSYIDGSNYTRMTIAPNGTLGIRQMVSGTNPILTGIPDTVFAGDKLTISRTGTSLVLKRNGVQVGSPYTAAAAPSGNARIEFSDVESPSSFWEISKFEVKDL